MNKIPKCEFCEKEMIFNKVLNKYECNNLECLMKRTSTEILRSMIVSPVPSVLLSQNTSIITTIAKSTSFIIRAIYKK